MLNSLIQLSRRYGSDSAFVLAGGGNTSFKSADRLWVKASGHALATIDETGFVELDRHKLDAMMAANWPADPTAREAAFVEAVMAARVHPELNQRPSVEALLHHLLAQPLVVHTHPGVVNALTCCTRGETLAKEWLGTSAVWQPYVDPGLTLALRLRETLESAGGNADLILLQNHGLIVAGESAEAIDAATNKLTGAIRGRLQQTTNPQAHSGNPAALERLAKQIASMAEEKTAVSVDSVAAWIAGTPQGLAAAKLGPLTPDQIVYCRSFPLILPPNASAADFAALRGEYQSKHGFEPWVAVVENAGVITFRTSAKLAETSLAVFLDAAAVYRDAGQLGGVHPLSESQRKFIEEWEVEAYRRAVAAK